MMSKRLARTLSKGLPDMNNTLFDTARGDTKTIDGMIIGGTTPAAASFTSLSTTGATTLGGFI